MLARRRIGVKRAGIIARPVGMAALYGWSLECTGAAPCAQFAVSPGLVVHGIIASIVFTTVLAAYSIRFARSPRFAVLDAIILVVDLLAFIACYALFTADPTVAAWPLLLIPLFMVSINHGIRPTIAAAVVEAVAVILVTLFSPWLTGHPGSVPNCVAACGVLLIVGALLGMRSEAFHRQLAELTQARRFLEMQAVHDPLTGLGNRAMLGRVPAVSDAGREIAVVAVDLDGFKNVNDSLGHAAGDHVLQVVAERLREEVRASDILVRLGGDEFAVIMYGAGPDQARALTRRLQDRISEPIIAEWGVMRVGASVGAAAGTLNELDQLLRRADDSMYRMKATPR